MKKQMTVEQIYDEAIRQWGVEKQLRQAQEECGELVAAINQYIRGTRRAEHVVTEIADVQIMVEQLIKVFGQAEVASERHKKLTRLEDRLGPVTIIPK